MTLTTFQGATGNSSFTAKAKSVQERLESSIPDYLRLPASILKNLPLDVTGIPESCGLLTSSELAITELDATTICQRIARGELSSVETVTAFGKRAAIAHQLTACLTDFFLEEGIAQAQELDAYYKREGKVIGPLHGLPISIKDFIPVKGRWLSAGFIGTLQVSEDDCDMTSILRQLGAVFYVKTNQPQGKMTMECHSFYARTVNPYNSKLSSGGSSGGEGALIALKGSCIGVGTDVGGSIRGPSAFCGIYGIRPTSLTTPMGGYVSSPAGQDGVHGSTGPMCRSAQDMAMFLHALSGADPYLLDPSLMPLSFDLPDLTQRKLRVGIMVHDQWITPHPPMLRALRMAREKLIAAPNVEVVEFEPYKHIYGYNLAVEMFFEDDGKTFGDMLEEGGEDATPLTEWIIQASPAIKDHDAIEMWNLHDKRDSFRRAYSDHWNRTGCDVVLCPPYPGVASQHDTAKYWGYTTIWNVLDYPGTVFPTGLTADPAIDVVPTSFISMSDADLEHHQLYAKDPQVYAGAPIALQLVTKRFGDGFLLAAQRIVEEIIKN
ncbi:amidase signature domain-containing protein [Hygrophoropsis aurantiaca]|uniref:Amidase signature domain-containing protein n=1 Tax=Hygrophoropsis aurantiaca TaxID=72124 RepID=A0ACB7ZXR2_9AGAM|nr:amidase signature domain-containing protein [Hygrophoropsis aurantiaca]